MPATASLQLHPTIFPRVKANAFCRPKLAQSVSSLNLKAPSSQFSLTDSRIGILANKCRASRAEPNEPLCLRAHDLEEKGDLRSVKYEM
jgi:hypothetical protein